MENIQRIEDDVDDDNKVDEEEKLCTPQNSYLLSL